MGSPAQGQGQDFEQGFVAMVVANSGKVVLHWD